MRQKLVASKMENRREDPELSPLAVNAPLSVPDASNPDAVPLDDAIPPQSTGLARHFPRERNRKGEKDKRAKDDWVSGAGAEAIVAPTIVGNSRANCMSTPR